jgi:hypothetical protein
VPDLLQYCAEVVTVFSEEFHRSEILRQRVVREPLNGGDEQLLLVAEVVVDRVFRNPRLGSLTVGKIPPGRK